MPKARYYIDWRETEAVLDLTEAVTPHQPTLETPRSPVSLLATRHSRLIVLEAGLTSDRIPTSREITALCDGMFWHEFLLVIPPTQAWIDALGPIGPDRLDNVTLAFKARTQEDVDRARLAAVTRCGVVLVLDPTEPVVFPPDAFKAVYLRKPVETLNIDFHIYTDALVAELAIARTPYYVEHHVTPAFTKFDDGGFYSIFSREVAQ